PSCPEGACRDRAGRHPRSDVRRSRPSPCPTARQQTRRRSLECLLGCVGFPVIARLSKSTLAHYADSSRTSPEVREVPKADIGARRYLTGAARANPFDVVQLHRDSEV